MTVAWPLAAIGISIAVVAAVVDMRTGKIPNMLTVLGMTGGLVGGAVCGGLQGARMASVGYARLAYRSPIQSDRNGYPKRISPIWIGKAR